VHCGTTTTSKSGVVIDLSTPYYMVRSMKIKTTGCGSYANLSEGVIASAQ
jgi:hypothetical protein